MALGSKAHKKLQFDHFHLLGNCLFHKMYKKFIYEFLMFKKKKKKKKKKKISNCNFKTKIGIFVSASKTRVNS